MLDFMFAILAVGLNGAVSQGAKAAGPGADLGAESAAGAGAENAGVQGLVAEPQTPSGKFTTAMEIRPILEATKASWVAVRVYDGQDLVYVTHLWSWRCGLAAMAISINDAPLQDWPLPPCHKDLATPNAVLEQDGLPYRAMPEGSVHTVKVRVVYDDLKVDEATFERGAVLIP